MKIPPQAAFLSHLGFYFVLFLFDCNEISLHPCLPLRFLLVCLCAFPGSLTWWEVWQLLKSESPCLGFLSLLYWHIGTLFSFIIRKPMKSWHMGQYIFCINWFVSTFFSVTKLTHFETTFFAAEWLVCVFHPSVSLWTQWGQKLVQTHQCSPAVPGMVPSGGLKCSFGLN